MERRDLQSSGKNIHLIHRWEDVLREQPDLLALVQKDAHDHTGHYRLFLGYAGWAPLQLENEIAQTHQWEAIALDPSIIGIRAATTSWPQVRRMMQERQHAKIPPAHTL
jgi:putative AlgH/UPF0301 family transcriptional regulator